MSVEAANALTARWAATMDGGSTLVSGACAYPLLALLAQAAGGPARDELAAAVGPGGDLLAALAGSEATRLALGVWTSDDLPLTDWWTSTVPASLRGRLSGDLTADQEALDEWAASRTDGLIPRMPIELTPRTRMLLASALSVTTTWAHRFTDNEVAPEEGPWAGDRLAGLYRSGRGLDPLAVADTPAGPVTLLTVDGEQDVDVVLALGEPARTAGQVVPAAIGALGTTGGRRTEGPGLKTFTEPAGVSEPELSVRSVRFSVSADHDLLKQAELFGLRTASDLWSGHFPGITEEELAIGQAKQSATATFTAKGFKAAAVTAIGLEATYASYPSTERLVVTLTFDRPFGFLAVHRPTGLVLVAGWVADPEPYDPAQHAFRFGEH